MFHGSPGHFPTDPYAATSPPSGSLVPDQAAATAAMTRHFNANASVTSYASGVVNTFVQQLPQPGSWYTSFIGHLKTAQDHANDWLTRIGPDLYSFIPQAIINYGTTFDLVAKDILKMVNTSPPPATLSMAQVEEIKGLIGALDATLQQTIGSSPPRTLTILGVSDALDTFLADIEDDHTNLVTAQGAAQQELNLDEGTLQTLNGDIATLTATIQKLDQQVTDSEIGAGASFIAMVAGLLLAPETGGGSLVLAFTGFGALAGTVGLTAVYSAEYEAAQQQLAQDQASLSAEQAQVTALQGIVNTCNSLVASNHAAQSAVEQIIHGWTTLADKMAAVMSDLQQADGTTILPYLEELYIQEAQQAWRQLVKFATNLQLSSITTQTVMPPAASPP